MNYYRYFTEETRALCYALGMDKLGGFPEIPEHPDVDPKYGVSQTLRGLRLDWFNDNKTIRMFTRAGGYEYHRCLYPNNKDCQCPACSIPPVIEKLTSHPFYIRHYIADSAIHLIFEFTTPDWVLDMIKNYGKDKTINILKEQAEIES